MSERQAPTFGSTNALLSGGRPQRTNQRQSGEDRGLQETIRTLLLTQSFQNREAEQERRNTELLLSIARGGRDEQRVRFAGDANTRANELQPGARALQEGEAALTIERFRELSRKNETGELTQQDRIEAAQLANELSLSNISNANLRLQLGEQTFRHLQEFLPARREGQELANQEARQRIAAGEAADIAARQEAETEADTNLVLQAREDIVSGAASRIASGGGSGADEAALRQILPTTDDDLDLLRAAGPPTSSNKGTSADVSVDQANANRDRGQASDSLVKVIVRAERLQELFPNLDIFGLSSRLGVQLGGTLDKLGVHIADYARRREALIQQGEDDGSFVDASSLDTSALVRVEDELRALVEDDNNFTYLDANYRQQVKDVYTDIYQLFNLMRRAITGQQASYAELNFLQATILSFQQGSTNLWAQLRSLFRNLDGSIARQEYAVLTRDIGTIANRTGRPDYENVWPVRGYRARSFDDTLHDRRFLALARRHASAIGLSQDRLEGKYSDYISVGTTLLAPARQPYVSPEEMQDFSRELDDIIGF